MACCSYVTLAVPLLQNQFQYSISALRSVRTSREAGLYPSIAK